MDLDAATGDLIAGRSPKIVRIDPAIDFHWGLGSAHLDLPVDNFAVRWTGILTPQYSERYTFYRQSDDGIKMWINGNLVIDSWVDQGANESRSDEVALQAGIPVNIKVIYYDNGGEATVVLGWSSPSLPKMTIPAVRLRAP